MENSPPMGLEPASHTAEVVTVQYLRILGYLSLKTVHYNMLALTHFLAGVLLGEKQIYFLIS